ncbi:spermatogenesis-associated protein 20 [Nannochloropsis oceanica]
MSAASSSSTSTSPEYTNRLIHEKSLYLLQHAHNPVDWWPWGEEAFARAKELNRPILLSVGYATCHWCHVMERESFESTRIAQLLNDKFVPIKVDREERPDVDSVYMSFIQAATGGGGWPMTVFLTPDRKPFTGGTYFPEPRFAAILEKVDEAWTTQQAEVEAQGERVVETFRSKLAGAGLGASLREMSETEAETHIRELQAEAIRIAFQQLNETYDEARGGFGQTLKFPRPSELNFLLSVCSQEGADSHLGQRALTMVLGTLKGMANGGIRDHVGGGFHRYSTDPDWHVPHFEKMLYDNAQLLICYVRAWQLTEEEAYANVAHDTARYLLRDMRDPLGGFYSAEDADSPSLTQGGIKKEGAFYVWIKEEIDHLLGESGMTDNETKRFCELFGIVEGGNIKVSADPHKELEAQNVLHLQVPLASLLVSPADKAIADKGRAALMAGRQDRQRPVRDEKVLACWTGLTITGLATAGRVFGVQEYIVAAEEAAVFLRKCMYMSENGVLRRCAFHGELSNVYGLSDDYAFLVRGLLDLYEATARPRYLAWATDLQETMDELFLCHPGEGRGYLSVSRGDASIAYPVSSTYDGAEPSATSVAVSNLLRLAAMTGEQKKEPQQQPHHQQPQGDGHKGAEGIGAPSSFARRAERLLATALQAPETPYEAPEILSALRLYGPGIMQVIIIGQEKAQDTQALLKVVNQHFLPNAVLLYHPPAGEFELTQEEEEEDKNAIAILPPMVRKCASSVQVHATAFVCQNRVCSLPMTEPQVLAARLAQYSSSVKRGQGKDKSERSDKETSTLSSLLGNLKPSSSSSGKKQGGEGEVVT